MTKFLLFVTGDHRSRESAVAVPTVRRCLRVTTRHPTQELSVVDDEIGERELVRVEDKWRNTERQDREPEVNQEGSPDGHGGIQEQEEIPHTHVDTWSGKTGVQDGE